MYVLSYVSSTINNATFTYPSLMKHKKKTTWALVFVMTMKKIACFGLTFIPHNAFPYDLEVFKI